MLYVLVSTSLRDYPLIRAIGHAIQTYKVMLNLRVEMMMMMMMMMMEQGNVTVIPWFIHSCQYYI